MSLPSEKKQRELELRMERLEITESDLQEKFILGGGKGGQKQNKTANCVQLKHLPSGITVKCQQERSREANRFFARRMICDKIEAKNTPTMQDSTIQWFPGHMAKARRQIEEILPKIDIVIEVLDARCPISSRNPMIDEIAAHKQRLLLLNKIDLADPVATKAWQAHFTEQGLPSIQTNVLKQYGIAAIEKKCMELMPKKAGAKAANFGQIRAIIVGIPNVGKSAIINKLAKKKAANVENRPAVTKRQQWIPIGPHLALCDTPGILWPKFEDQDVGKRLAISGSVKATLVNTEDISFFLLEHLIQHYPKALMNRYKIDVSEYDSTLETLEAIGRKRGCLARGGDVDYDKTYEIFLNDFRKGKLGLVSLELP
jgi:ribosome biogenesis GTPase A